MQTINRMHNWCLNNHINCELIAGGIFALPPLYFGLSQFLARLSQNSPRQEELPKLTEKERRIVWQNAAKNEFPDEILFRDSTQTTVDQNYRPLSASDLKNGCFYEKIETTNHPELTYFIKIIDEPPAAASGEKKSVSVKNYQNEAAASHIASCFFERIVSPYKDSLIQCSGKMIGGATFFVREQILDGSFKHPLCYELCGLKREEILPPESISLRK